MKETKSEMIVVRIDKETKQRLDAFSAFEGVGTSEALRIILRQIPVIGKISGDNAKLVQADGEVMTIEEELARR